MQDRATDLLPPASAGEDAGDGAYEHVRDRVQELISAARDLSDTCADLADALRPLPGHDDAAGHGFGRLRAERTAALLDEAASAARGTLGLLHSAYSALERQVGRPPVREPAAVPRSGVSTWPDAFVELPPRTFSVEDEAGTVPVARRPPGQSALPFGAPAPAGPPVADRAETGPDEVGSEAVTAETPAAGGTDVDPAGDGPASGERADVSWTGGLADGRADAGLDDGDRAAGLDDGDRAADLDDRAGAGWDRGAEAEHRDESQDDGDRAAGRQEVAAGLTDGGEGADADGAEGRDDGVWRADPDLGAAYHTVEDRPADDQPADVRPADVQPADDQPADVRPADDRPADDQPADDQPAEDRPADEWTADDRPADEWTADDRAAEDRPGGVWGGGVHPDQSWGDDAGPTREQPDEVGRGDAGRHGMGPDGREREAVATAAFAGWVALDPDDEEAGGVPIAGRSDPDLPWGASAREDDLPWRPADPEDDLPTSAVAAQQAPSPVLTLPVDPHSGDGPGWHGDTVSPEPRSLSLVPPVPEPDPDLADLSYLPEPTPFRDEASDAMPAPDTESWAAEPRSTWQPVPGLTRTPVWATEVVPGATGVPGAGDGLPVYPLDTVDVPPAQPVGFEADADVPLGQAAPAPFGSPLDDPGAAVIARQVEAARRHLQAALVVANQPAEAPRLGALLTAVERVLTAVTDLARETRGVLEAGLVDRTFPGEARFLCSQPWERTDLVGRDSYGDDVASPSGLAKLLRSIGYEATSVTSAGGVAGVQVRSERYAAHIALVEPAGGGRQRWSGALEWKDARGASRTWAETLGPVELDDEELARRVDELLRRCVGPLTRG